MVKSADETCDEEFMNELRAAETEVRNIIARFNHSILEASNKMCADSEQARNELVTKMNDLLHGCVNPRSHVGTYNHIDAVDTAISGMVRGTEADETEFQNEYDQLECMFSAWVKKTIIDNFERLTDNTMEDTRKNQCTQDWPVPKTPMSKHIFRYNRDVELATINIMKDMEDANDQLLNNVNDLILGLSADSHWRTSLDANMFDAQASAEEAQTEFCNEVFTAETIIRKASIVFQRAIESIIDTKFEIDMSLAEYTEDDEICCCSSSDE